ncbi:MAG: hypothetical protein WBM86_04290 [Waterburya sp.]
MKHLAISAILLLGWILFWIISNRNFFITKIFAQPINHSIQFGNSPGSSIREDLRIELDNIPRQTRSELYKSISSGMSYEEVTSIIGWEGVLIYDYEVNDGGETIQTKVYQWNYEDIYSTNSTSGSSERVGVVNPYSNLTLEFQNDLLVDKTFSDLKP